MRARFHSAAPRSWHQKTEGRLIPVPFSLHLAEPLLMSVAFFLRVLLRPLRFLSSLLGQFSTGLLAGFCRFLFRRLFFGFAGLAEAFFFGLLSPPPRRSGRSGRAGAATSSGSGSGSPISTPVSSSLLRNLFFLERLTMAPLSPYSSISSRP